MKVTLFQDQKNFCWDPISTSTCLPQSAKVTQCDTMRERHQNGNRMGRCSSLATIMEFLEWSVAAHMGEIQLPWLPDGCHGGRNQTDDCEAASR